MKNYLSTLLLLLTITAVQAQFSVRAVQALEEAREMTLEECIELALAHNPNLNKVRLDEQANEYQIKEIKSSGLPQINGNGRFTHNYALAEQLLPGEILGQPGTTIPVTFGVANMLTGSIEASQLLYSKSYRTGLKAAEATRALTALNTFKTTEDLVYNVAHLYLQLQITNRQIEILDANLERIDQLINISQIQFEEGIIKKIDVDQLRVNRTNLLTERKSAQLGVTQQLNLLKLYMGVSSDMDVEIAEYASEEGRYPLSPELNLAANTNIRLLDQQVRLNEFEIENIKAGYYPTLSAFVNYGWQGQTDKLFSSEEQYNIQGSETGVFGLSLNVPIFDGFQKKNQIQQAQIRRLQLGLDRQYLTNSVQVEYANANEQLQQNKSLLVAQKENMELAEELYGVTKLSYREGVAPLTELLNAETSLKEAQTQYLTALLQLNLAELDYMHTSGQLATMIRNTNND